MEAPANRSHTSGWRVSTRVVSRIQVVEREDAICRGGRGPTDATSASSVASARSRPSRAGDRAPEYAGMAPGSRPALGNAQVALLCGRRCSGPSRPSILLERGDVRAGGRCRSCGEAWSTSPATPRGAGDALPRLPAAPPRSARPRGRGGPSRRASAAAVAARLRRVVDDRSHAPGRGLGGRGALRRPCVIRRPPLSHSSPRQPRAAE